MTDKQQLTILITAIIATALLGLAWFIIWARKRQNTTTARDILAGEDRIGLLVDSIQDYAIFLLDAGGRVMTWNKGAEFIKGYRAEEVIGQPISIFYTSEDNKKGEPSLNLEQASVHGRHSTEGWRVRKDGALFWSESLLTAIYDSHHRVKGFVKVTRDITERRRIEEQLSSDITRTNEELRQLASHLQNVREEERASIAREIHDELGQQLTGIKMDLSWISRKWNQPPEDPLQQKITGTLAMLDNTIRTVRRIATQLRPSILDDLGLVAAIEWQSQEFAARSGIRTQFQSTLPELDFDPRASIGLFRICQESLTNVARHSGAKNVWISLDCIGEDLHLSVMDDGRGFNRTIRTNTLGLLGMEERATMMGGSLEIKNSPYGGVAVEATIPLTKTIH
ncbi:PAS domain-containing sensor histidine kinase [Puia sp. P3]|uniref:PAS domain-containing sensor histidine kinase n=1 Tax=Puia sp. P3 TaxID=3423952 RepID=UPI003D669AE2